MKPDHARMDYHIPAFYCPIESAIHPAHHRVEQRAFAWINTFHLAADPPAFLNLAETRAAEFISRIIPRADEARLQLLADYAYWLWAVDDGYCDLTGIGHAPAAFLPAMAQLCRIAEAPHRTLPELPEQLAPAGAALRDLFERIRTHGTPAQLRRWALPLHGGVLYAGAQITYRGAGTMPSPNTYLTARLHASGDICVLQCIDLVHGTELDPSAVESPPVRALLEMAAMMIALDNDLIGAQMEEDRAFNEQNIITVLAACTGLPVQQALRRAVELRDTVINRFLELYQAIAPRTEPDLRWYLDDLRHSIRANIEWALNAPRYAKHFRHPIVSIDRMWTTTCTAQDPPAYLPSFAWWWEPSLEKAGP
ncbi:hypothetical protein ACH427_28030 [Streptomyces sp. NPDC020379]|uniref:terpene synthase family protein n=1 Tax=Streptomyces sp. NPDC020379 TaxID=3365071 RepID=UPI0037AEE414